MEIWFIAAVIAAIANGIYSFIGKVSAEKKFDTDILLMHSYFWALICAISLYIYRDPDTAVLVVPILFILSFISELAYYFGSKIRIKSLEYIDTSIYFPMYKTLGPVLVVFVGLFLFNEPLSFYEWLGVFLGIVTSLLLLNREESKVVNFKKRYFANGSKHSLNYDFGNCLKIRSGVRIRYSYICIGRFYLWINYCFI